jgi:hypothetical protein
MLLAIDVVTAMLWDLEHEEKYPYCLLAIPQRLHGPGLAGYVSFTVDLLRYMVDGWAYGLGWQRGMGVINARERFAQIQAHGGERVFLILDGPSASL